MIPYGSQRHSARGSCGAGSVPLGRAGSILKFRCTCPEFLFLEVDEDFAGHLLVASAFAVYVGELVEPRLGLRPRGAVCGLPWYVGGGEQNCYPSLSTPFYPSNTPRILPYFGDIFVTESRQFMHD